MKTRPLIVLGMLIGVSLLIVLSQVEPVKARLLYPPPPECWELEIPPPDCPGMFDDFPTETPTDLPPTLTPTPTVTPVPYSQEESAARQWLERSKRFRQDISPYQGNNNFDALVRRFDYQAGFTQPYGDATLGQRIQQADNELYESRNRYILLVVDANEAHFRADPNYSQLCPDPGGVDWCNFRERLRESVRERANIHLIFGQEFLVKGLDFRFGTGLPNSREIIRDEVAWLQEAASQFEQALDVLVEGYTTELGSGCYVSDLYIAWDPQNPAHVAPAMSEWLLLSQAVEGMATARYQLAMRQNYVAELGGPSTAMEAYIRAETDLSRLIATTTALKTRQPVDPRCTQGDPPDDDLLTKMAVYLSELNVAKRNLEEGRNLFGFDVRFTPARPFLTFDKRGIWDDAQRAASLAKGVQEEANNAKREFDNSQEALRNELQNVKTAFDGRLGTLTGCRSNTRNDDEFFGCVSEVLLQLDECGKHVAFSLDTKNLLNANGELDQSRLNEQYRKFETIHEAYDECLIAAKDKLPDGGGLIHQNQDRLVTTFLRVTRVLQAVYDVPQRIDLEVGRKAAIIDAVNSTRPRGFWGEVMGVVETINVSLGGGGGSGSASLSFSPFAPFRELRQQKVEIQVLEANSEAVVKNLWLDFGELLIDLDIAVQEFDAQATEVQSLFAEVNDLVVETRRARAYARANPGNDPSFRLLLDQARLELASHMERAKRLAYMAAKRVEYERAINLNNGGYFCPLSGSMAANEMSAQAFTTSNFALSQEFRLSNLYIARTANDIIDFLECLNDIYNNVVVEEAQLKQEDFKISIALHYLGLTDENLGLTSDEARHERLRRFRAWVAEHTRPNPFSNSDGKPVLMFNFTTSMEQGGIFSNVIRQGYDRFWLHQLSGTSRPLAGNFGFRMLLQTDQPSILGYRRVVVTQSGTTHQRAQDGCILEYRLIHPAALLGFPWPAGQNPESVTDDFKAGIGQLDQGEATPAFVGRPVSATDWQIVIFSGAPEAGFDDLDLQTLVDIELHFSTVRASREPSEPNPASCVRTHS